MTEDINSIHTEIQDKIHKLTRFGSRESKYLVLNLDLWGYIQENSSKVSLEPDGFWYLYDLKITVLDGSNLQARHLEVA